MDPSLEGMRRSEGMDESQEWVAGFVQGKAVRTGESEMQPGAQIKMGQRMLVLEPKKVDY